MKTPHFEKNKKESSAEVKKIFRAIAPNYDRANRFITLGMDKGWRKKLVQWSHATEDAKILDCATGTGVLAFEFQKYLGLNAQITGVDFCEEMLKQAHKAMEQKPRNIFFKQADIQKLPFPNHTFDVCSIAYGLRNVTDPAKALKEMARVTKKGGKVMILETGDKPTFFLKPFFYLHFRYVVPFLGGKITGQKTAYQYLQKTSRQFPSRHFLLKLMQDTKCFDKCEYKALFFGASFIYKAQVISSPGNI